MNTVDLINDAKKSAEEDNKLYSRSIGLLQEISFQVTEGDGTVSPVTLRGITKLLDDSYNQALKRND